jgi:hypothetical protein
MAVASFVYHHIHPMLGVDGENCIFVPDPTVKPYIPYITLSMLSGNMVYGPKYTMKVFALSTGIRIMQEGTDCGYGAVPHIGYVINPLWPLMMIFCKSKSNFACSTVKVENKCVATAIPYTFGINVNCGTVSTPTGFVICPTTIFAGLSFEDLAVGICAYLQDLVVDLLFKEIFGSNQASNYLASRVLGGVWSTVIGKLLPEGAQISHELIKKTMEKIVKKIVTEGAKKVSVNDDSASKSKPKTSAGAVTPNSVFSSAEADTFGVPV